MSIVHLVPESTDAAPGQRDGDYLVRSCCADEYELGKVAGGDVDWYGSVPKSSLPDLPQVSEPQQAPDQQKALIAVEGVETAYTHRGA